MYLYLDFMLYFVVVFYSLLDTKVTVSFLLPLSAAAAAYLLSSNGKVAEWSKASDSSFKLSL